jgi:hypothetical protein
MDFVELRCMLLFFNKVLRLLITWALLFFKKVFLSEIATFVEHHGICSGSLKMMHSL